MAQSYTRQSTFSDGDTITASLFNNEYNQLLNSFSYSASNSSTTGHRHDGTAGQGGNIFKVGDLDFLNKIEVDSTNNRWGFYVEVSSAAVEQIRIQDGAIVPVTDNDIDLGTSSLQFKDLYINGTANLDSLTLSSGSTVTVILDEDDLSTNSATALATQQSIKAYVDAQVTAQDFDFSADSGGALSIDLDSEAMTFTGGTGIDTSGSGNAVTFAIDSTVATLTGTQTFTNKTLTSPDINGGTVDGATIATSDITVGSGKTLDVSAGTLTLADNQISGDKVEGGTIAATTITDLTFGSLDDGTINITAFVDEDNMASDSATLVPTQQSVKAYVDSQVTAQDLDVTTDSGTIAIDLDSETLTVSGGTGLDSSATGNAITVAIDSTVTTLTGSQTLTNKTLTAPVISGNLTTDGLLDGRDVAADGTKLDGVEASADVTDTTNVTAAGALMDSEVTNLAQVKAFDSSDYATAAQGTTADAALPKAGGAMTGAITTNSTFDGRDVATDGTKLDGIEASADVTDTANVTAAGALMDSELTAIASVKALNQGVATSDSPSFTNLTLSGTGSVKVPAGTTGQRDGSPAAGMFRYNSSLEQFEGYTSEWGSIGGGGGTNTFTTDSFTGNGSTTAYALSQVTSSEDNLLVFIEGVFQQQDAYSIATSSGTTTLTFSAAPANGNAILIYSVAAAVSGSNLNIDSMTGDGSDTTLTLSIAPVNENNTQVFIDGVYQSKANYSISGTTLTFSTAPPTGTAVEVMTFTQTDINVPVDGTVTSAKLSGDLTTPGALTVTGAVGINIAPTSYKLTINSGATTETTAAAIGYNGDAGTNLYINTDHGNNLVSLYSSGNVSKEMRFLSGSLEVMRLGTTGNVGIGTSSPATQLFVKSASNAANVFAIESANAAQRLQFGVNTSNGGSYIFEQKAQALRFGTSDTERMRIDSSGNVGIGVSSPAASEGACIDASGPLLAGGYINQHQTSKAVVELNSNEMKLRAYGATAGTGFMTFATSGGGGGADSEAMRITSAGKMVVNGTVAGYSGTDITVGSPSQGTAGLSILSSTTGHGYLLFGDATGDSTAGYSGQINYAHSTNRMGINTNNVERLAIHGTGQVEATSSVPNDYGLEIKNTSSTNPYGLQIDLANGTSNTTQALIVAVSAGANKFIVWTNGNAQNVNNSYTGLSDLKLKENIIDSGSQWDDLKAVRVRKYSLKDANLDAPNMLGVIAQELEEAGMNGLVDEHPDKDDENNDLGTVTKSVSYSILYMKAIKALQEAMERIETLEAKVQTLENN